MPDGHHVGNCLTCNDKRIFDSHLGVPMFQIRLNNPRFVINLLWNLMIDILLFYGFVTLDPFQLETLQTRCAVAKPMFGHLVQVVDRYVYPGVFVVNVVFSYLYGAKIVQCLDSDCIYAFYTRANQWRVIYTLFVGSHFLFFFLFYSDKINVHGFGQWPTWEEMLRYCCMYACLFQYWVCGIVHYAQYAMFRLLTEAAQRIHAPMSTVEQYGIVQIIGTLALINQQLNQLISVPMLIFLVLNTFNIIMFVCMALLCEPVMGLLLHALVTAFYLSYLIALNHRVLCTLRQIVERIRVMQNHAVLGHNTPLFQVIDKQYSHREMNNSKLLRNCLRESMESRTIRCNQLDIYHKYFVIKLFRLVKLDVQFLLQVSLFILSYVVLITQTN